MKKYFVFYFLILLAFVGCSLQSESDSVVRLNDSRFNGDYSYSKYWKDSDSIEETNEYYSYDFNGTNKCTKWYKYHNYRKSSGWSSSSNYPSLTYEENEIEINDEKTHFRVKLWDNDYSSWGEWKKYEFLDNNRILRIWNYPDLFPDVYEDYHKND